MNNLNTFLRKKKVDLGFKQGIIPEINQKSYESQSLLNGKIVKITKNNIYFDIGFKNLLKSKKKNFITTFFEIEKMINSRRSDKPYDINTFLNEVKIGKTYKLMVYQVKSIETGLFINFEKTLEYAKNTILFYELEYLKKKNQSLKGYILNSVNGGFSVGIGGIVGFIPNNEITTDKNTQYQSNRLNTKTANKSL